MDAYRFEDPRPLGAMVITAAALATLLRVTTMGTELYLGSLIHGIIGHDAAAARTFLAHRAALASMQHTVNQLTVLVLLLSIIVFCFWMYRVSANVRALGANGLEFTPGWAVGYMFIPFANLVMTYRAMLEVWTTSHDPSGRTVRGHHLPVTLWWLIYLGGGMVGGIATVVIRGANGDPRQVLGGLWWHAAALLTGVVAGLLFIFIVWRTGQLQAAYRRQTIDAPKAPLPAPAPPA